MAAGDPRWKAVNDLIHELSEVQRRYRDTAGGEPLAPVDRRLRTLRRALLGLTDEGRPEEAVEAAWSAMAAARRTLAWSARTPKPPPGSPDQAPNGPGPRREDSAAPEDQELVRRILRAAREGPR